MITALPTTAAGLAEYYGDAPLGVRANMLLSLDGAGAFRGRTKALTDATDQELLGYLRGLADVIVVGSTTVEAEDYGPVRLTEAARASRVSAGQAEVPALAVVTARAALPLNLRVFDPQAPRPLVLTTAVAAAQHPELADVADVLAVGEQTVEPPAIVSALQERGLPRIHCEGGPFLLSRLIEDDLVDDMCLTLAPYLAGTQPTTTQLPSNRELPTRLRLRHVLSREDLLYLRYSRP